MKSATESPINGREMKAARARKGWTQERLGTEVRVDRHRISRIENGRAIPSLLLFLRIAKALDTAVETLVDQPNI